MRLLAILKSQWVETYRNPTQALMPLLCIAASLVFSMAPSNRAGAGAAPMLLIMCVIMVGSQLPALSMAEEKERRTMEAMLLTPVRPLEIIGAKLVVSGVICIITSLAAMVIMKASPVRPGMAIVGVLLGVLFSGAVGVTIGLLSEDQKSASIIGTPVVMLLLFAGILPISQVPPLVATIMKWLPTLPMQQFFEAAFSAGEFPSVRNALVVLVYTILTFSLSALLMRRQASAR